MLERSVNDVFEFSVYPPIGVDVARVSGNTANLLEHIPQLFASKIIPNAKVLNFLLVTGVSDAGMGGKIEWDPYVFLVSEFNELVNLLVSKNGELKYVEPSEWVTNLDDWNIWIMFFVHNIPWEEHKKLNDHYLDIIRKMNQAYDTGDTEKASMLHLESIDAGEKLAQYIMENK